MDNRKIFDECGSLLLFNKASKEDIELLLLLVARGKYCYIDILRELVSSDRELIKLLDVMAGVRIQFPDRRKIYKTLEKVFIYNYCKARDFSEESYKSIAKQYQKRVPQVKAIVDTMNRFLEAEKQAPYTEDIDDIFKGVDEDEEKVYKE